MHHVQGVPIKKQSLKKN